LGEDDSPHRIDQTELSNQEVQRQDRDGRRKKQTKGEIGKDRFASPENETGEHKRGGAGKRKHKQRGCEHDQ
jgi:hypothetical protein